MPADVSQCISNEKGMESSSQGAQPGPSPSPNVFWVPPFPLGVTCDKTGFQGSTVVLVLEAVLSVIYQHALNHVLFKDM